MAVKIGSNISSLQAQRRLTDNTNQLSKIYERLSSGARINRASDDAAGLAISESLKTNVRVFNQGIRNLNDGISLLNIADGAVEQLSGIVVRLKELAEQAANGTYGATQRKSLDAEAQALSKEYTRIVQSTKFNDTQLLNGSLGNGVRIQAGFGVDGSIFSGIGGAIGTGTFRSSLTSASLSEDISLGDLNGDGMLDRVTVATFGVGSINVALGRSDGSFNTGVSYQMDTTYSHTLQLGDLNGDGVLDVVSAGVGAGTGRATVRLGNGDGTFGNATSYQMDNGEIFDIALGDLNGDGILDMVTAAGYASAGTNTVRFGTGDGRFGNSTIYAAHNQGSRTIALGDINGDGTLDLVSGGIRNDAGNGYSDQSYAHIRLGSANGTFGATSSFVLSGSVTKSIELKDLNGDGKLDMAAIGDSSTAEIKLGLGNGNFATSTTFDVELDVANVIKTGDLNGDGIYDLVIGGYGQDELGLYMGKISTRLGKGDGTFSPAASFKTSGLNSISAMELGDVDNDGVLDVVSIMSGFRSQTFLSNTKEGTGTLLPFDLSTQSGAKQALPLLGKRLDLLSKQRGTIGAFQSRIGVAGNVLSAASENFAAAEGRIRDTDIASDSANLARLQILQKASSAILGQANLQPSLALSLLAV